MALTDKNSALIASSSEFSNTQREYEVNTRQKTDEQLVQHCIEPLNEYLETFATIKAHVATRKQALLDYDAARRVVQNYTENPPNDSQKLPMAEAKLEECKQEYTEANESTVNEIKELIDNQSNFLDPIMWAAMVIHVQSLNEASVAFENFAQTLPDTLE
eukprot:TRINITY_DN1001_c0_g2_i2.p2 TRINITY_DN1001_c0_g2~~TRINITY_DN1001_c0_g2_i2.p2  ORF type:complete len:160 (+),score=51.07 TRINITY_DN1001_c0_g2_i2:229-708(+)